MDNAEDALPDVTDGGDILAVRSAADLTPQAVAEATPSQLVTLVEPLLNLLNQTSRQLAPLLEKGGAELEKFVTPVGATLQEWSLTLQPLVERGGDEVNKVLAPVREQLEQLQARLEPYTTPAIDAARSAVTNVVDVIKGLLHQLAPLWQEACRGTLEWHATQLTPFLATTGEQIKLISVAALDTSAAAIEDVKLRSVAAAQVGAPHHCCHTLRPHLPLPHPPSHHGYHTILTRSAVPAAPPQATQQWNETTLQPWAAQTGQLIQEHTASVAGHVRVWNANQLQPWWNETNAALCAVATEWWMEALRCFCLPIASAVAMAGLKEHADKLHALVPPEKGPAALGVYPAAAEPTVAD